MENDMTNIFLRNVAGTTEVLSRATVAIAGCGGLGSNVAVSLVRAGVGSLILVDSDLVEASNLNRQHFFIPDIGKSKVDALSGHLLNINPDISLSRICRKIEKSDVGSLFGNADILIEAFDIAESKAWLIETWCLLFPERPVISASGIAGFGKSVEMGVRKVGAIYLVGDGSSDMTEGLCSARVALAANMQANIAIEILMAGEINL